MRKLMAAVMVVALPACGADYKLDVDSSTSWSCACGNRSVDGSGDQVVELPDETPVCATVQKDTREGRLSAKVVNEGGIFGAGGGERATTTAEYGVVSVCSGE